MSKPSTPETLKKKRLIVLFSLVAVFVILALLNTIDFSGTPEISTNAPYAPDTLPEHHFYPAPDGDLSNDAAYVKEDRTPAYIDQNNNEEDLTASLDAPFGKFFIDYLAALKNGDHAALNALYSEVYCRNHAPYSPFTKQLLYDVTIKYLYKDTIKTADTAADKAYLGWHLTYFEVSYKIYRNDGSFRRDIVDDMTIVQVFTILTDTHDSDPHLNSISYYRSGNTEEPNDTTSLLPLIMPLVFAGLFVVLLVLSLIIKKPFPIALAVSTFTAFLVSVKFTLLWQILSLFAAFGIFYAIYFYWKKKKATRNSQ